MLGQTGGTPGAHTGATGLPDITPWVTIITSITTLTVVSCSVIKACNTPPSQVITGFCISVTVACPTLGESPVSGLTLTTVTRSHVVDTQTLTSLGITKVVPRSILMAVTSRTPSGPKVVGPWGTAVTLSAHHVGFTQTLSPSRLTL